MTQKKYKNKDLAIKKHCWWEKLQRNYVFMVMALSSGADKGYNIGADVHDIFISRSLIRAF